MKKNFFKKLSFVIALAMIISVVAPAAGAFAATKVKLNATKKYLHLGVDGKDEYNFNIVSKKGTGWKYSWESSNDDVVVVNKKNGVATAAGVGTAKVTVFIVDKDGEEVGEAKATVVVRDNIKEVSITNKPAGDKVSVGVAHDFNRSFVTFSGSKKVTSAITRWSVEPADGATIDDKGIFTATKAGEYTITAKTYQSKAKFEANEPLAATDSYKVTVPVEIVKTAQINKTKFVAEFNTDVSKTLTKDNAFVYQVINGKQVATGTEKIKSVAFDGNKVTVELYGSIVSKGLYNFVYGDATGSFTGASAEMSDVAGIVFDDFTVAVSDFAGQDLTAKVSGVNKDGVVIKSGADLAPYLEFTYEGDVLNGWVSGHYAGISKSGYSAVIKAKYSNFQLDSETNTYKTVVFEDQATATGLTVAVNSSTMQFTVKRNAAAQLADSTWPSTPGLAVPAGDSNYNIHVRYRNNNQDSSAPWTYSDTEFTYVSTNADKLVISGNYLYPISQGVVTVLVKSGDDVVNTFDITIMAGRTYASAIPNKQMVALGNFNFSATPQHNESATVDIVNKDSMNEGVSDITAVVDAINGAAGAVPPTVDFDYGTGDDAGKVTATFKAVGATPGAFNVKIKLTSATLGWASKTVDVYVSVLNSAADQGGVVRWAVQLDKTEYDMKKVEDAVDAQVAVYGYNKNNARIAVLADEYYSLTVKRGNSDIKTKDDVTDTAIPVATVSNNAISFVDFDTYVVTAYATSGSAANPTNRANGAQIGAATFVVKDTTSKELKPDTLTVKTSEASTVADAVKKAFNFKINDVDVEGYANISYIYTNGGVKVEDAGGTTVTAGQNVYIEAIKVPVDFGSGNYVTYKIDVNRTITITN